MPIRPPKLLLLDLDGTVYRGDDPIPGAAETIGAFRAAEMRVLFVTNRANRTVATVARQLRTLGIPSPKLLQEALRVAGYTPEDALVVGDCLDTDIAAAAAADIPSCLLLTGVSTRSDAARSSLHPDFVCANWAELRGKLLPGQRMYDFANE